MLKVHPFHSQEEGKEAQLAKWVLFTRLPEIHYQPVI